MENLLTYAFEKTPKTYITGILTTLFVNILLLAGCDCPQKADGIIIDRQTNIPIDGVIISTVDILKNTITGRIVHSTKNGRFKFYKISGGLGKCPNLTLYFYKPGFKQQKLMFSSSSINDTVYFENVGL